MQLLTKTNVALLLILTFSVGYLISSTAIAQQNNTFPNPPPVVVNPIEPEEPVIVPVPQDNTIGIIALIGTIGSIVAIVVKILPTALNVAEQITGLKIEQKEKWIATSQSIGQSDLWQLETLERMRTMGKGVMMVFPVLQEILNKPEVTQALEQSQDKANQIKEGMEMIQGAIPSKEELKQSNEEIVKNAQDPNKAG